MSDSPTELSELHAPDIHEANARSATIFGSVVGSLAGGVAGWLCCRLLGEADEAIEFPVVGVIAGATLGLIVGAAIGYVTQRGKRECPDIGTIIWVSFMTIPGGLILLTMLGTVPGLFNGFGFAVAGGAACAGPMAGMIVGAICDRIYESAFWKTESENESTPISR